MNMLVEIVKTKVGCGYVWATDGEILTPELLIKLKGAFGRRYYDLNDTTKAEKWLGKQVFDCSGLIIYSLRQLGFIRSYSDFTAGDLFNLHCTHIAFKESLKPGDLLFKKNMEGIYHVGVYIGDNKIIEAHSTQEGVILTEGIQGFNLFGRLKYDLDIPDVNINETIDSLLRKRLLKSPEYWKENLIPGGMVKSDYVIKLLDSIVKYLD